MAIILDPAGSVAYVRAIARVRGTGTGGVWRAGLFVNGLQGTYKMFSNLAWATIELPIIPINRGDQLDLRLYSVPGEADSPAELAEWRIENMCQISCAPFEGGILDGQVPITDEPPCDPCGAPCLDCGGDFPGDFPDPFDGGGDFEDPGTWDSADDFDFGDEFPPWEEPFDDGGEFVFEPDPIFPDDPGYPLDPGDDGYGDPVGDVVVEDPITGGLYDTAYYIRTFLTVPSFSGWAPDDEAHFLGLRTEDQADASIDDLPGLYLKSDGKLYGTHALLAGTEFPEGTETCVECRMVVNGDDGSIDQAVYLNGTLLDEQEGVDPEGIRDPPSAAVVGIGPVDNPDVVLYADDPVWNTNRIGCGESSQSTDPIFPGDPGYPYEPGDGSPPYGDPYYPPVVPVYPGDPGYPYDPGDPNYGDPYYPPGGVGSEGSVNVSILQPTEGFTVSATPVLIQIDAADGSGSGGISQASVWLDDKKLGDAFGEPLVFFWDWTGTEPGAHQLRALVTSTSGATVYSTPVTVYVPDVEQPDVAILSPAEAATVGGLVEIAVEADDNVAVGSVTIYVDDAIVGEPLTSPPYRATVDTSALADGAHSVRAVAVDAAGNVAEATHGFLVGPDPTLTPWSYSTMGALAPRLRVEIDFENDPFVRPAVDAIVATQPWAYLPLDESAPDDGTMTTDATGWGHTGVLFGTWAADPGGGFRTTAMRDSGIIFPAPARRPSFGFAMLVRPRSFGEEFPMRILDTGGLRLTIGVDGSLRVDEVVATGPAVLPAGDPAPRLVALLFDADNTTVGTASDPTSPGPRSHATLMIDGEIVARKSPLSTGDVTLMARSTGSAWTVGGGAGDLTVDEIVAWMRPVADSEIAKIHDARSNPPTPPADVWTDVTAYVRGIDVIRGSGGDVESADVATGVITLDDPDRRFEPEHAASPYYPGVTPGRSIRVQAFRDSAWVDVWRGSTGKWPTTWGLRRGAVALSVTGRMVSFGRADDLRGDYSAELAGARLSRVLDAVGVPDAARDLDAGKLTLLAHRVDGLGARDYIDRIVTSEYGLIFEDAAGRVAFHDRDHRQTDPRSIAPRFTLGDGGPTTGELPYVDAIPDYDPDRIVNDVSVEWPRGTTVTVVDGVSRREVGPKAVTLQTLLASERSATRLARTVLEANRRPRWRFPSVSVEPKRLDALYDVALDTEVSDRLVVVRRPPGGGDPLRLAVYVEQIRHAIEVGTDGRIVDWRTTFGLSTIGNAQGSTVAATLTPANTVSAPPAAASASAAAPVVDRLSSPVIVAPAANAIATAAAARSAFVVSPPATATAASVAPNLGQTTRQAPAAAASAAAPLPTLSQRTIVAPVAAATASRVAPLANVTVIVLGIASPERSPLVVSDDFNRADVNPLPTSQGWVAFGGTGNSPFKLVSNQMAVITAGAIRRAWYSPGAVNGNPGLPADLMDVFATVATKPATGEVVGVVARTNGPHGAIYDSYEFRVTVGAGGADDVVSWVHFKAGTGDIATLASTTFEIQDGDVLYARSIGAYMTGWILRGGTVVLTLEGVEATSPSTLGDAQRRGVLMSGTTGRLDDFGWVARPRTIASAPIPTNFGTGVRRAAPAIAYGGAFLVDAFGRDTVYGWRQPDSGPAWVVPSDVTVESFDVTGGRGRIRSNDSLSQRAKMFTTGALILSADWQATGRVRLVLDALSSHSFFELMLRVGDTASFAPRSYTFMRFEVDEDPLAGTPSGGQTPGTTGPILIATAGFRNSGGGESFADPKAIGLQVLPVGTTSSWWRFRYQQRAGKIEAAVWLDGGSEPADPQLIAGTLTDTTGPLGVQVYGGNGGHDVTWEVDDLVVEPLRNHLVKTGLVRAPAARAIAFRPRPFV